MKQKVYVLISDVGMNGNVVHGVYEEPPSEATVAAAVEFCRGWTGYGETAVEERELNRSLFCGGHCTRPANGTWGADCYCYANGTIK